MTNEEQNALITKKLFYTAQSLLKSPNRYKIVFKRIVYFLNYVFEKVDTSVITKEDIYTILNNGNIVENNNLLIAILSQENTDDFVDCILIDYKIWRTFSQEQKAEFSGNNILSITEKQNELSSGENVL